MLSDRNLEGSCHLGVWLLYDNARVHKSVAAQQAIRDCPFLQLSHPEYSQDLGPSNYFLFRNPSFIFVEPGLQTLNHRIPLLKHGLIGKTKNRFSKREQFRRKTENMH